MLTADDLDNLRDLAKRQPANHAEKKILAAVAEIERLYEWQRQMVDLAAGGGRLDGYRELAAKLAAKDETIDRLRAEVVDVTRQLGRLRENVEEAARPNLHVMQESEAFFKETDHW